MIRRTAHISLKHKILGIILITMVMAISLITWHNLRTQKAMLTRIATEHSRVLADTIRNSFITAMAAGENDQVASILANIQRSSSIESIHIFDETGRILMSANPEEIGSVVETIDLVAFHDTQKLIPHVHEEDEIFCTVVPIRNSQSCHQCHDAAKEILGVLNVHISLKDLESLQKSGREATLLSSIGMLTLVILVISWFFLFYVDSPIRRLIGAMTLVEQGDFEKARTDIQTSAEMTQLSTKFNAMVEHLRELIDTKVRHEKELAVKQEQLVHHEEIQNMNITLEDRLKEIEYLNITLEERIEEIEEANYKIADLASELESKNTSLVMTVNRLSALYKMGLAVNSTMELDRLFDLLLRKSTEVIQARIGYILMLDAKTQSLSIEKIVGAPTQLDPQMTIPLLPGGVSKWVIETCQPLLIKDMREAGQFNVNSMLGFTRETVICAPLVIKGEVIGTITAANKVDGTFFNADDLELLSTIAAQASVAINNARLYKEQQLTYLATVQALVSAIEASDPYTRGHSERVTRYCQLIGGAMGLNPDTAKRLEQAAVLHDIGKIGIDIGLLHKEELLTGKDIETLQQHPLIGEKILEPIHFLRDVRGIIAQHHERFDGQGYPLGLTADHLSIEARVLSVADTFDAMTSDRPYRAALPKALALQEIEEHAGSQFDPQVVTAFAALFREGKLEG